tara:strand:+ start:355 stop:591 length:237 start_codon:yes stop_codon:yes gene_type:complete
LNHKLDIGVAAPVIIMGRTHRISLWDIRTDFFEKFVVVPEYIAFPSFRRELLADEAYLRHRDDLAHAEDEIRHSLADH